MVVSVSEPPVEGMCVCVCACACRREERRRCGLREETMTQFYFKGDGSSQCRVQTVVREINCISFLTKQEQG
jgi:hypothetical protein